MNSTSPQKEDAPGVGERNVRVNSLYKVSLRWTLLLFCIIGAFVVFFIVDSPPDPLVYCQKQFDAAFEQWKMVNKTNEYPNIEGDSKKSFTPVGQYIKGWEEVYEAYGYVPGLKDSAPKDLVLMYLKEKTRKGWNGDSSATIFTRKKWMVIGPQVMNLTEWDENPRCAEGGALADTATFRKRLQKTFDFLKENNRPNWEAIVKEHTPFLERLRE